MPHDLEWVLESLEGLRTGGVAAFSIDDEEDGERVVIVAECRFNEPEDQRGLINDILWTIRTTAGVDCEVVLVPTRSLTFTSSGKLSRAAVKADYLSGILSPLDGRKPEGPPRAQEAVATRPVGE